MRRIAARDERGAAAIMVAIFLTFVMIPALLITVDVGRVYTERRQLQSGADAAALAVAQDCATGPCAATSGSRANEYADPNANDGGHTVPLQVCGTAGDLPGCGGYAGPELTDCLPLPPDPPDYVQVHTSTDAPGGLLFFGGDETIAACGRAAVDGIRKATGLAFTASACEWDVATNGGTVFGPDHKISLAMHAPGAHADPPCPGGPGAGWGDAPGGFGFLDGGGDCNATVDGDDGTYEGDPGGDFSQECRDVFQALVTSGETVFMPIFDEMVDGEHITYHFYGWAAFVLTGYELPGGNFGDNCIAPITNKCVTGYFTEDLLTDPDAVAGGGGSEYTGATMIGMIG